MIKRELLSEELKRKIYMKIPHDVRVVMNVLNASGYAAYIVGGAVRDILLDVEPKDWDIATNAPLGFLLNKFIGAEVVGASFGVVLWRDIQIAHFRQENGYSDYRHPDKVQFVETIEEDLSRRDFTINAIAVGKENSQQQPYIVFPESAFEDLNRKIISAVGDANKRFKEDALRMMRAARFATRLDGQISLNTYYAMISNSNLLQNISAERIQEELNKILLSHYPSKGIDILKDTQLLEYIIPEMKACYNFPQNHWHAYDVYTHILVVLRHVAERSNSLTMRLAALFHDIGKPTSMTIDEKGIRHFYGNKEGIPAHWDASADIAYKRLNELRYDKQTIKDVCTLVRNHMSITKDGLSDKSIRRRLNKLGYDMFVNLIELKRADFKGSGIGDVKEIDRIIDDLLAQLDSVVKSDPPITLRRLTINGDDVISIANAKPGKWVGNILSILMEEVLDDPLKNNKEYLLDRATELSKRLL